ncbi:MAG: YwaF family protein [Clostridia bacterium]|nr:YwaF family protein [Clostridia bacterium]
MLNFFFSPENTNTACGMFTVPHIVSLILCLILVGLCVFFSKNLTDCGIKKIIRILSVVFTVMEIIKIVYKICYGYTEFLDYYLPISFCSLFIPSLWLCGYGKGLAYRIGYAFIRYGCSVGGLAFLIVPATSLMMHPIYHYLSIHSMLFHSAMLYLGVIFLIRREKSFTKKDFLTYSALILTTCFIAITLNLLTGSNLMLLAFPVNIPVEIVNTAAKSIPALYTACAIIVYTLIPFGVSVVSEKIANKIKKASS